MLLGVGAGHAQIVPELGFEVAGWEGRVFAHPETHRFDSCQVMRDYENGVRLMFTLDTDTLYVSLYNPAWNMRRGAEFPTYMYVDGQRSNPLTGYANDGQVVDFPLEPDGNTVAALRFGNTLRVDFDGRRFDFSLSGTSRALAELQDCVATNRTYVAAAPEAASPAGSNAGSAPGPGDRQAGDRMAQRLEATELVTNILTGAGIGSFQLIGDDEGREYFNNPDALWSTDYLIGSTMVHDDLGEYSIDDVAIASIIGSTGCADGRNIASQRERIGTLDVVNVAIECIDDGESTHYVSTFMPRRAGGYYELTYGLYDETGGREQLDQAMIGIRDAATIVVGNGTATEARRKGALN
jgi:hypothetical protein